VFVAGFAMRVSFLLAAAVFAVAMPANAASVIFSQNFDSLPQGIPAASVPGFSIIGTVDVVTNGNFGITCVGNSGACLDIDGTPGPGALTSNSINFLAGRATTISFDLSGNQRDQLNDNFRFDARFASPTTVTGLACTSGFVSCGTFATPTNLGPYFETIAGTRGWVNYSLTFTPTTAGSLTLGFSTNSADNIGPLLDNVLVTQASVPEPQSWAMLIAGFGLVGAARRSRRRALAA
jgi:hypothetical protein